MRRLSSYVRKYPTVRDDGRIEGAVIYTRLQREANLASQHAKAIKRLRRREEDPR